MGATVLKETVAADNTYVNAARKSESEDKKNYMESPPGDLIVVQCYAGSAMAYMKVLIDSGSQTSTISESALFRTPENKNVVNRRTWEGNEWSENENVEKC